MVNLTCEGMARYKEQRIYDFCQDIEHGRPIKDADIEELMTALILSANIITIENYKHLLSDNEFKYVSDKIEEKVTARLLS